MSDLGHPPDPTSASSSAAPWGESVGRRGPWRPRRWGAGAWPPSASSRRSPPRPLRDGCWWTQSPGRDFRKEHVYQKNFSDCSGEVKYYCKWFTWAFSCSAEWRSARMRTSETLSMVRPVHKASSHITFSLSKAYLGFHNEKKFNRRFLTEREKVLTCQLLPADRWPWSPSRPGSSRCRWTSASPPSPPARSPSPPPSSSSSPPCRTWTSPQRPETGPPGSLCGTGSPFPHNVRQHRQTKKVNFEKIPLANRDCHIVGFKYQYHRRMGTVSLTWEFSKREPRSSLNRQSGTWENGEYENRCRKGMFRNINVRRRNLGHQHI